MPITTIKLLARWGSSIVEHYLSDVPLGCLTEEYRAGRSAPSSAEPSSDTGTVSHKLDEEALAQLSKLTATFERQDLELARIRTECDKLRSAASWPPVVLNVVSGCYHHSGGYGLLPALGGTMRTPCGWNYTAASVRAVHEIPACTDPHMICSRCLPHLRQSAAASPSDSDSS